MTSSPAFANSPGRRVGVLLTVLALLSGRLFGAEMTLADYDAELEKAIAQARARPVDAPALDERLRRIASARIQTGPGHAIALDLKWLRRQGDILESLPEKDRAEHAERIAHALETMRQEAAAYRPMPGNAPAVVKDPRQELGSILAQNQFRVSAEDAPGVQPTRARWLSDLREWLHRLLRSPGAPRQPTWLDKVHQALVGLLGLPLAVVILVLGFFCALIFAYLLLVQIFRYLGRDRAALRTLAPLASSEPENLLALPPGEIEGRAARLAREGQYRLAIRELFLALLAGLHRARVLTYDKTRTNWEYLAAARSRPPLHDALKTVVLDYDVVWYGQKACVQADYDAFDGRIRSVRALAGEGAGAAAPGSAAS